MRKKAGKLLRLKKPYRLECLLRPGLHLSDKKFRRLHRQVLDVASDCFDEIPRYQIMVGTREEWSDKVVAFAWRRDGKLAGFCSTVILWIPGVGKILHLGLTCVRKSDRSAGLTHMLTKKAIGAYLVRHKPVGKLWISNCAAVLSSLGNVAKHFKDIYPAPGGLAAPRVEHFLIAAAINTAYRKKIYIMDDAIFDADNFVFRGSVKDTVFQKSDEDARFHHRQQGLNDYYRGLMDFENGDEVLQIGYASTFAQLSYQLRRKVRMRKAQKTAAAAPGIPDYGYARERPDAGSRLNA